MFGGGGDGRMMEQIFNLKFTSKQLVRQSVKCEREEKEEKLKACTGHLQAPSPLAEGRAEPRHGAGEARY